MGAKFGAQEAVDVLRFCAIGRADRVCCAARPTGPSNAQGAPLVGLGPKPRGGGSSSTASWAEPPSPPPPSRHRRRRAVPPVRASCTRAAVSSGALFLPPCACMWAVFRDFWLVRCVLGAGRTFGACPFDLSVVEWSRERPIGHLCCHRVCVPGSRFGSGCMIM